MNSNPIDYGKMKLNCIKRTSGGYLTLLWRVERQRAAVHPLELIKVGSYFNLVLRSFEQVGDDGVPLRCRFHILLRPGTADRTIKQAITLDVLRLTVDLGDGETETRDKVSGRVNREGFKCVAGTHVPADLNAGRGQERWLVKLHGHLSQLPLNLSVVHTLTSRTYICRHQTSIINWICITINIYTHILCKITEYSFVLW